ncbi:MAG TPA: GNAT family N-acetyltransferase [Pyrinomonadaceae bacterium]|nr:GNAT family N-acetyltransferase [Pyrinomonadaceae bacterium]
MAICALPTALLVGLAQRTLAGTLLYLSVLIMVGRCVLRREHVRLGVVVLGLIPWLMLLRNDFSYNLLIVLLVAVPAFWCLIVPHDVAALWANFRIRLLLILSVVYWLISFFLTGDYSVNLRALELTSAVCVIFLLSGSYRHLLTALVGLSLSTLSICVALLPYGERLGMASVDGHRLGNPITLGIPLALVVTLAIADQGRLLSFAGRGYRIALGVVAGAFLLITTSRGAWAVAAGNLVVLMFLGKRQRLATVGLLVAVALSVPLIMATQRGVYLEQGIRRTLPTDRTLTQLSSGRSDQWLLFPRLFSDSPFWGYGPGLGQTQYAKYSLLDHRVEYKPGELADWHSLYLQLGVDAGLIGLFSLALIAIPLLWCCLRYLRVTGQIVPLLGVTGFLIVAASVSAMDAVSGVFLGLAFLSTKEPSLRFGEASALDLRPSVVPLTRPRVRRYLNGLMRVDATTMGDPWGPAQWMLDLPEKWRLSWCLLRANEPIGFVIATKKESSLHIHRLAIAEHERDSGLGKQLLGLAARRGQVRGCHSITLKVDKDNKGAIRFYHRLGFRSSESSGNNLAMFADSEAIASLYATNANSRFSR